MNPSRMVSCHVYPVSLPLRMRHLQDVVSCNQWPGVGHVWGRFALGCFAGEQVLVPLQWQRAHGGRLGGSDSRCTLHGGSMALGRYAWSMHSHSMPAARMSTSRFFSRCPQAGSQTYLDVPAPPSRREPLWCEQEHPGPIDLKRQIYCNRSLNMKQITVCG